MFPLRRAPVAATLDSAAQKDKKKVEPP